LYTSECMFKRTPGLQINLRLQEDRQKTSFYENTCCSVLIYDDQMTLPSTGKTISTYNLRAKAPPQ
jgi:hypothetical protein